MTNDHTLDTHIVGVTRIIQKLDTRGREVVEALLDTDFVQAVQERSKEIARLRKENKLLSLADLMRA